MRLLSLLARTQRHTCAAGVVDAVHLHPLLNRHRHVVGVAVARAVNEKLQQRARLALISCCRCCRHGARDCAAASRRPPLLVGAGSGARAGAGAAAPDAVLRQAGLPHLQQQHGNGRAPVRWPSFTKALDLLGSRTPTCPISFLIHAAAIEASTPPSASNTSTQAHRSILPRRQTQTHATHASAAAP